MSDPSTIQIRQATAADVDALTPLFDQYRQFYGQPSDTALARAFLAERLKNRQSIVFIAVAPTGEAVGFTQLYPSFSSVSAARIFVLNDLFVIPAARRSGVAGGLLESAGNYARSVGAVRLSLTTAVDNIAAQSLYLSRGWQPDKQFVGFDLSL